MKILRRDDNFKKMPEKNHLDILAINEQIKQGWNYCAKQIYKDFFKNDEKVKEKPKAVEKKSSKIK